jgi:hypothetical protein
MRTSAPRSNSAASNGSWGFLFDGRDGAVMEGVSSGTLKPKMNSRGVASNSFAQYSSLGNW